MHDLGPEFSSRFFWFNLNRVQPPVKGEKPVAGRKVGDTFVDPVKYAWFSNLTFRRAVSMAVDRDARGMETVRGLFSATQIARQLGAAVPTMERARTFAEIKSALAA